MQRGIRMKLALTAALVVCGCMTLSRMAKGADEPKRIEVSAKRFAFSPAEITIKKGEPVVLVFHSEDVTHGIRFEELGLKAEIVKGSGSEVRFTPDRAGDFVGHCSHFCGEGHGSMILTLHITD